MRSDLATVPRYLTIRKAAGLPAIVALSAAGFRRYATYRQATLAASVTNSIFGFLRCFVLLATLAGAAGGLANGYDMRQVVTYTWVTQGLIGVVLLYGWTDLADRIRTGDVLADLLRPVHPVISYLAVDLGRAGYAVMTRLVVPLTVGDRPRAGGARRHAGRPAPAVRLPASGVGGAGEPLGGALSLPGVHTEESSPDGRLVTFSLDGTGATAGELVARLASLVPLRDISVQEPAIEDVIARLYASAAGQPCSITSTAQVPGSSAS